MTGGLKMIQEMPKTFLDSVFVAGREVAWPPEIAAEVVEWLGNHDICVLGAEVWIVTPDSKISTMFRDSTGADCIWTIAVNRDLEEPWNSYCQRAASVVSESIRRIDISDMHASGRPLVNITYVSEREYIRLID
jgi:hypothetical protein